MRERDAYVQDFNKRKAEYTEQHDKWQADYDNYVYAAAEEIKKLLKDDLAALPGANLEVRKDSYSYGRQGDYKYYILIYYTSDKYSNPVRQRDAKGDNSYFRGIRWKYYIYLYADRKKDANGNTIFDKDGNPEIEVNLRKEPQLNAELLDVTDYPILKATYDLFNKIETKCYAKYFWQNLHPKTVLCLFTKNESCRGECNNRHPNCLHCHKPHRLSFHQ